MTGKSGLTFQEAVASEAEAHAVLGSMSFGLQRALLYLTKTVNTSKFNDICHLIQVFASHRFFAGEEVEAITNSGRYVFILINLYFVICAMTTTGWRRK